MLAAADEAQLQALVAALEAAWNRADADAFTALFAEDADFVIIIGVRHKGHHAIRDGHAEIFRTIYAGSRMAYTVEQMRALTGDVALVHLRGALEVPQGPMAGTLNARLTMVATRHAEGWRVAALQTTQIRG